MGTEKPPHGIWLEVADVQLEIGTTEPTGGPTGTGNKTPSAGGTTLPAYRVQLKADREHPRPVWWPVATIALTSEVDLYHTILREIDRKRVVLARLTYDRASGLHCDAFRFQSAELGNR